MTDQLPAPLVPAEVDLRDFGFMPLDVVRLPPGMEWGCVNWRGHQANVADLQPAQVSRESQSVDAVSTRAGEGG